MPFAAPTFALAAIAILGFGVGMASAMFAIYRTVLADRLPVTAQDRLVVMHPLASIISVRGRTRSWTGARQSCSTP